MSESLLMPCYKSIPGRCAGPGWQGLAVVRRQAADGYRSRPCRHRCPRGIEDARPSRVSCVRNVETLSGSALAGAGSVVGRP